MGVVKRGKATPEANVRVLQLGGGLNCIPKKTRMEEDGEKGLKKTKAGKGGKGVLKKIVWDGQRKDRKGGQKDFPGKGPGGE